MSDSRPCSAVTQIAQAPEDRTIADDVNPDGHDEDDTDTTCSICLQSMEDRTIIPMCSHEFCFDCLMIWTAQSRRCPLCTQTIGGYFIHDIRSRFDYRKHHLPPLVSSPSQPLLPRQTTTVIEARNAARRRRRDRQRESQRREDLDERDKLELSVATRRWVYKHDLYAKHVASNSFTKYRPYPTPVQFAASSDLISRTTTFLRRELQVWQGLDIEFLTNLIISLMRSIDIRSESAVKLLAEFLDMDIPSDSGRRRINAEHFAHEVYSYVRSPYRDLFMYDSVVQYDNPPDVSPPPHSRRPHTRWNTIYEGREGYGDRRRSRSRSSSPSRIERGRSSLERQGTAFRAIRKVPPSGLSSSAATLTTPIMPESHDQLCSSQGGPSQSLAIGRRDTPPHSRKGKEKETAVPESIGPPENGMEPMILAAGSSTGTSNSHLQASGVVERRGESDNPSVSSRPNDSSDTGNTHYRVPGQHTRPEKPFYRSNQPPRKISLTESVRAHLSLEMSSPMLRSPSSQHSGLQHRMSLGENSHHAHERLPLLQRLSDPVTTFADQTNERLSTWRHAPDPRQPITDTHDGIALGSELVWPLESLKSPSNNETSAIVWDLQPSTPLSVKPASTDLTKQRLSSLDGGPQDDSGENTNVERAPANPSQLFVHFSSSSSSVQTYTTIRTHINNLRDEKEADQRHVGHTPPATRTHGPHNPAPIIVHQDQNSLDSQSDLREKLLFRLEEERRQANEARNQQNGSIGVTGDQGQQCGSVNVCGSFLTPQLDRNFPKRDNGADRSLRRSMQDCRDSADGKGPDPTDVFPDSAAREASLRARMYLRAKLLAEKRSGEVEQF